ncbi:ester cyclase [Amnibacterium kyonggiense]
MTPDELRWWFDDWLDASNRHDFDRLRELLAPDVRRAGAPAGADAWVRDLEALLRAFPDYRWKRIALVVEDDRIAAHLRTRGTHRGEFHGVRPTGRHVGVAAFGFFRVVRGRLAEFAGSDDDARLLAQLV